ncbi:MAG: 2-succinyl-5-enolpyruvyl-6-hydroxy-3-cyclohexene-1-carboxylic-acid synthase [Propionibacteriaceae bacterium]|nr:2-succinyl-5-enolpyruvyl-6-hydroxy-3-cyclohexene-1-carboxylic-acid synthase [Propionibacteriaceae bacterium]
MNDSDLDLRPALWCAAVIVDELVALGVADIVVCPGSRSAPLVYAAQAAEQRSQWRLSIRVDERSAGFFALGLAKASGRAVVVVTTSGTAVANLGPALLEARHSHIPLIALTADRPATLVGTGANQTTDQIALFPGVARRVIRLASSDRAPAAWRSAIRRGVVSASGRLDRTPGPVHLNVELTPPLAGVIELPEASRPAPFEVGPLPGAVSDLAMSSDGQVTNADVAPAVVTPITGPVVAKSPNANRWPVDNVDSRSSDGWPQTRRAVIVAGDLPPELGRQWAQAAAQAHLPLLAEPSSNARRGPAAIQYYRELMPQFFAAIDDVLVVGHPTLSRDITALLADQTKDITVVAETADWIDPGWAVRRISPAVELAIGNPAWLTAWQTADAAWSQEVQRQSPVAEGLEPADGSSDQPHSSQQLTGPVLVAAVWQALGPDDNLVLGASQLIRDAETAPITAQPPRVWSNRGLAGIDGTIATARGIAAATGRPTTALIGDLTAIHDLTSLIIPSLEQPVAVRLVIGDDNGGAIFRGLEYGGVTGPAAAAFERCFQVPTGLDLVAATQALGATATAVTTLTDLTAALAAPWSGVHVIVATLSRRNSQSKWLASSACLDHFGLKFGNGHSTGRHESQAVGDVTEH